jgi:hypothetical protein
LARVQRFFHAASLACVAGSCVCTHEDRSQNIYAYTYIHTYIHTYT